VKNWLIHIFVQNLSGQIYNKNQRFANFSFLFFPSDGRMGVAVSLISVQIYEYIPTKAHKLRKFLSVTPGSGKKWVKPLFSTFLRFFD